jgi:hypothetical protein
VKTRHAAALALVGWYLMVPPLDPANMTQVDTGAPLSKWHPMKSYSSKVECDKWRDDERATGTRGLNSASQTKRVIATAMSSAQCIASDDPRLKESRMNLRHTAALALVGWYLMLLPKGDDAIFQVFDIPWSATQRSFDTAQECEAARAKAIVPPDVQVVPRRQPNGTPAPQPITGWFGGSEPTATDTPEAKPVERAYFCIETDDPRLKADRTN